MEQKEAREAIKMLLYSGMPVHPDRARKLYEYAGYDIPEHLKKREYTDEERKQMEQGTLYFMNALK